MTAIVLRADAAHLPLPDASVDLIVTSPPFWSMRNYTDGGTTYAGQLGTEPTPGGYIENLLACTREWMRALKPTGSIWVNVGDKYATGRRSGVPGKSLVGLPWRYALGCIDTLGLILRAEVIWSKPNPIPDTATDRVRRCHESWFHFATEAGYHADVDPIREPHLQPDRIRADVFGGVTGFNGVRHAGPGLYTGPRTTGRVPGSVWTIAAQPFKAPAALGVDHYAPFPMEWPRRIIAGWSPPGGVVADPFGGTGTTALVASVMGRTGISVDMSADYCRIAQWRTADPGQRARAAAPGPTRPAAPRRVLAPPGVRIAN